jgi:hypothetical protein
MLSTNRWQLPVVGRLGLQHGLAVGWFLLVGALAVMLLPGPAGGAASTLAEAQTVTFGDQSHCGIVVGIGGDGEQSGHANCASVESGEDSQVNTGGFGDIGMQFQKSPVGAPIVNVHNSNQGNNNANNTIVGNHDLIINTQAGIAARAGGGEEAALAAAPAEAAPPEAASSGPDVSALPVSDPAGPAADPVQAAAPQSITVDDQSHCGIVGAAGGDGEQSGSATCASVESGRDSQVNTRGFGDIGMQFQQSPVNAPIVNVHNSSAGNNNSTNTIVGDSNAIINFNFGIDIHV